MHSASNNRSVHKLNPPRTGLRPVLAALLALLSVVLAVAFWQLQQSRERDNQAALTRSHSEALKQTIAADLRLAAGLLDALPEPDGKSTAEILADTARRFSRGLRALPIVALAHVDQRSAGHPVVTRIPIGDGLDGSGANHQALDTLSLMAARDAGPEAVGSSTLTAVGQSHLLVLSRNGPQGSKQLILDADRWSTQLIAPHLGWLSLALENNRSGVQFEEAGFSVGWHARIDPAPADERANPSGWLASVCMLIFGFLGAALLMREQHTTTEPAHDTEPAHSFSESEVRMQRALQLSQEGIWEFDLRTRSLTLSGRTLELLGLDRSIAPATRSALQRLSREWRREFIATALRARYTDSDTSIRFCVDDVRSGPRWLDARIRCTRDKAGRPQLLSGTLADVTAAVNEVQAHEQMRAMVLRVLDALPVAIALKSADQKIALLNEGYASRMIEPLAELMASKTSEALVLQQQLDEMDQAAVVTQLPQETCLWLKAGDSEPRYVRLTRTACDGLNGEPLILSTFEDLTSMLRRSQEHERRSHDLQNIFDALPHPLFVKDAHHRYVMSNRAHANSLGLPVTSVLGRRSGDFVDESLAMSIERSEEQHFARGTREPMENEYTMSQADGQEHAVIIRKALCTLEGGQQVIVGVVTDVSALRRGEHNLRQHRDQLSALVNEQSQEITLARESAARAMDTRASFYARLSHELRSPIHAILSYARLGESHIENLDRNRLRDCLRSICRSAEAQMQQLNALLDNQAGPRMEDNTAKSSSEGNKTEVSNREPS